jgi:hypothetical protein
MRLTLWRFCAKNVDNVAVLRGTGTTVSLIRQGIGTTVSLIRQGIGTIVPVLKKVLTLWRFCVKNVAVLLGIGTMFRE